MKSLNRVSSGISWNLRLCSSEIYFSWFGRAYFRVTVGRLWFKQLKVIMSFSGSRKYSCILGNYWFANSVRIIQPVSFSIIYFGGKVLVEALLSYLKLKYGENNLNISDLLNSCLTKD
jgi:hypothetical protein